MKQDKRMQDPDQPAGVSGRREDQAPDYAVFYTSKNPPMDVWDRKTPWVIRHGRKLILAGLVYLAVIASMQFFTWKQNTFWHESCLQLWVFGGAFSWAMAYFLLLLLWKVSRMSLRSFLWLTILICVLYLVTSLLLLFGGLLFVAQIPVALALGCVSRLLRSRAWFTRPGSEEQPSA